MSENKWEGVRWVVESYDTIDEAKEDDPNGWSWAFAILDMIENGRMD